MWKQCPAHTSYHWLCLPPYQWLEEKTLCRCASPVSNGDAYTPFDWATDYFRVTHLELAGNPITWVDAAHQLLDVAGTGKASMEDLYLIFNEVFHSSTYEQVG